MQQKIVYKDANGTTVVIAPAICNLSYEEIARKDVPKGVKYWVVDSNSVPSDISDWDWDTSKETWVALPKKDPLIEWRKGASLDRSDFCLACVKAGILPPNDAIKAAKGDWPDTFSSIFSSMNEVESLVAQIEWASVSKIRRSHPLISALANLANIPDNVVDKMFGWEG